MRGAQEKPDLVEGIACASAVSGRVLLDAAAYLTWGITGELDVWKASRTLVASWSWPSDGVPAVPWKGSSLRFALPEGVGSFVYEVQSSITKESAQQ